MGALAALRASFIYEVTVNGCGHSGGLGGGYCYKKREIAKRAVAGDGYLAAMSAAAGMSAINLYVNPLLLCDQKLMCIPAFCSSSH